MESFEKKPTKLPEKYEKEFLKCKKCKKEFLVDEAPHHNSETNHVDFKSLGTKEYIPTVQDAQKEGYVVFVENKTLDEEKYSDTSFKHIVCDAFLVCDNRERDVEKKRSIKAHCLKCEQRFLFKIQGS